MHDTPMSMHAVCHCLCRIVIVLTKQTEFHSNIFTRELALGALLNIVQLSMQYILIHGGEYYSPET